MARLKDKYKNEIVAAMQSKFGYKNIMEVPKLEKVIVNKISKVTSDKSDIHHDNIKKLAMDLNN